MAENWINENRNPAGPPAIRITNKKFLRLNEIKAKPENDREEVFFTFCIANIDPASVEALMPKTIGETVAVLALIGAIPMERLIGNSTLDMYDEADKISLRPWIIMKHAQLMLIEYRKMMGGE